MINFNFFLRERETAHTCTCEWGGAEGEGERESQADSMLSLEPGAETPSHDPEIMTWAEIKSRLLN